MATECEIHECACAACRAGDHPEKEDHRSLNLILSRLDEQQRRWVAGREARRRGHGGVQQVADITGPLPGPFLRRVPLAKPLFCRENDFRCC